MSEPYKTYWRKHSSKRPIKVTEGNGYKLQGLGIFSSGFSLHKCALAEPILTDWEYSFLTQSVKDYVDGNLPDVDEHGKENLL